MLTEHPESPPRPAPRPRRPGARPARTVAVVDDDDLSRLGIVRILEEAADLEVAACLNHGEAMASAAWADADVVLVDAADTRDGFDDFPGVGVVQAVRRTKPRGSNWVIVVTGHYFDDALRRRMGEAGADLFFHRSEVQDRRALCEVLRCPEQFQAPVPAPDDAEALFRHGVTERARVNEGLDFLREQGIGVRDLEASGRRSRAWERLRDGFNQRARLTPVNADGLPPERDQRLPSRPQIARFLRYFTEAKQERAVRR